MSLIFPPESFCSFRCNSIELSSEGGVIQLNSSLESAPRHLLPIPKKLLMNLELSLGGAEKCCLYKLF